jgi:hypothetical protein
LLCRKYILTKHIQTPHTQLHPITIRVCTDVLEFTSKTNSKIPLKFLKLQNPNMAKIDALSDQAHAKDDKNKTSRHIAYLHTQIPCIHHASDDMINVCMYTAPDDMIHVCMYTSMCLTQPLAHVCLHWYVVAVCLVHVELAVQTCMHVLFSMHLSATTA